MFSHKILYTLPLLFLIVAKTTCQQTEHVRVAVAHLVSLSPPITGSVAFTETEAGLRVTGAIVGLAPGHYGFHIHELGDISTCDTTGAHFNPDGTNHGGRDHEVRHVGDLGNVEFVQVDQDNVAYIDFTDDVISLRGRNSILGRAVVLHEQMDDLGLGNHETSLTTGNAGARVACGVIGMRSPSDPWNSGISIIPSAILLIAGVMFAYL